MPKKDDDDARRARANDLRKRIRALAMREKPQSGKAPTPREMTEDAAQAEWMKETDRADKKTGKRAPTGKMPV